MKHTMRLLSVIALLVGSTVSLSCNVNEYCINCATGDGGNGDGGLDDGGLDDSGFDPDAIDAAPCVPTSTTETCDGQDNDCNGQVDDGVQGLGVPCQELDGECAGGVTQCAGGQITCTKAPMPEACDNKDNDCDTIVDEGDPGGGAVCGTNTGECVAGAFRCMNGALQCLGSIGTVGGVAETCNNRDDDCDGTFDEDIVASPCVAGVDGPAEGDEGACALGMRQCVGGTTVCVGAVFPGFELCDTALVDQDCDGQPSNGYNTATDPQNCGGCGTVCDLPNAFEGCSGGNCTILACAPNHFNNDGMVGNGCEFNCGHPFLGNEVCNGVDDDCDGLVDGADPDMITPTGLCDSDGACSTMTTLTCNGMGGWVCNYNNPNVSKDAMGFIIPETRCDSDIVAGVFADNDCDGRIDEGQANLGMACSNGGVGDCSSSGAFTCDSSNRNGAAVCTYTQVGPGMQAFETCDGRDNDCDNLTDEGADTGNLAGQEWVSIPNTTPAVQIMKYEASRPDATATGVGTSQTFACSRQDVQPWANVNYPTAVAACDSIGARLCTEAEWQQMCVPSTTYPVDATGLTTATTDFVFIEAEDYFANTTIPAATPAREWTKIAPASFNGITAMQVPDNNFAVIDSTTALAQSSRMDYRLNLAAGTNYNTWLRVRAPATAALTPYGVHAAPVAGLTVTSDASTEVGDLIIAITWTPDGDGAATHTAANGFTQIFTNENNDGTTDTRMSAAYFVATTAGAVAYTAYTSNKTPNYTGLIVIKNGRYDLGAGILSASTDSDTNNAPNPPDAGNFGGNPYAVLAIGGWHLGSAATASITPPGGFAEAWELSGSNAGELSVALGTADNPGSFGDDVSPNNTSAATVAIRLIPSLNNGVWVGLTAGGAAGNASSTAVAASAVDQWQWRVGPTLTSGGAGLHTFSIYTQYDGMVVDTIAISRQNTTSPTFDDSWAYQDNPRTPQPETCNSDDYDTDPVAAGDQDGILATGALPMCFANKGATDRAFDMSGNVKEWTQARSAGENPIRGGASNNETSGTTCGLNFTSANDTFFFPNVGFRCCR